MFVSGRVPKNASSITITVEANDPEKVYKALAAHLMSEGYSIEQSDKELGYINTERKKVKYAWEVRILTSIIGNKIKFTGKQFLPGFDKSEETIRFFGAIGAMYKTCFNEVERVAKLYPNTKVEYGM